MTSFVKKYLIQPNLNTRWIIVGEKQEYIVTDNSCSCKDFQLKVLKGQIEDCKHLTQLEKAKITNLFDLYEISISEYQKLRKYFFKRNT